MTHSRASQYVVSLVASYASQIVSLGASFLITPVLLDLLGAHEVGRWLVILQLLGYLLLVDLGVSTTLGRQLGSEIGRSGTQAARRLVEHGTGIVLAQWPFVIVVSAGLGWLFARGSTEDAGLFALLSGTFCLTFPTRVMRETLRAAMDLGFLAGAQLVATLIVLGVQLALVMGGGSVVSLAIGWAVGEILLAAACAVRVMRRHPELFPRSVSLRTGGFDLAEAKWMAVAQLSQVLLAGSDLVLVGHLLGAESATTYSVTNRLVTMFSQYPQQILIAAAPALVSLAAASGVAEAGNRIGILGAISSWAMAGIGTVVLAANASFVGGWGGGALFGGWELTLATVCLATFRTFRLAPATGLFVAGRQRVVSVATLASGVVSLAIAWILSESLGLVGVALGFLFGVVLIEVPVLVFGYARASGTSALRVVAANLPIVVVAAIAWAGAIWVGTVAGAPSIARASLLASGAAAGFLLVSSPLFLSETFRAEIGARFHRLAQRVLRTFPGRDDQPRKE